MVEKRIAFVTNVVSSSYLLSSNSSTFSCSQRLNNRENVSQLPIPKRHYRPQPVLHSSSSEYEHDTTPTTNSTLSCDQNEVVKQTITTSIEGETKEEEEAAAGIAPNSNPLDGAVLFGEFLSTFLLVFFSLLLSRLSLPLTPDGFLIAVLATSFIPVSGAHFNPAVTIALLSTQKVHPLRALAFVPLQLLGSVFASLLASSSIFNASLNPPIVNLSSGIFVPLFKEFITMFWVVTVVFLTAVASKKEGGVGVNIAPLYIGMAVVIAAAAVPGAVFNPARAFGPAIVTGFSALSNYWILWVGSIAGGVVAAFMCEHLFLSRAGKREATGWLASVLKKTGGLGDRLKNLGVAGIISYGIMNTLYYSITFSIMMIRMSPNAGAAGLAQAWFVTWSLSQVTKPLRLGISVLIAPFVNKWLKLLKRSKS